MAFVIAYMGEAAANGTRAAEIAGYGSPAQSASRQLTNVKIRAYIDEWTKQDPLVMSAHEIQRKLSAIARGECEGFDNRDRVKALEMLCKTRGMFIVKVEAKLETRVTVADERAELDRMIGEIRGKQQQTLEAEYDVKH